MSLDVVAAVPNYNMAETVVPLTSRLLNMDYRQVIILDDRSTDSSAEQLRDTYPNTPELTIIEGTCNIGAGGNRNRVLFPLDDALVQKANPIIHFVDADTIALSEDSPAIVNDILGDSSIGVVGGLVLDAGHRSAMNFGPKLNYRCLIEGPLQERYGKIAQQDPDKAQQFRDRHSRLLARWPDVTNEPQAQDTFWVQEANMAIRALTFKQLGGFDPRFRFHEIQDLALKMQRVQLRCRFDPNFVSDRADIHVRTQSRNTENVLNWFGLIGKYGLHQLS